MHQGCYYVKSSNDCCKQSSDRRRGPQVRVFYSRVMRIRALEHTFQNVKWAKRANRPCVINFKIILVQESRRRFTAVPPAVPISNDTNDHLQRQAH